MEVVPLLDNIPVQEAERIPENIAEGDVVRVRRFESGTSWIAPLYVRGHLVDQLQKWNLFMDDTSDMHAVTRKWKLYVTGAPGCGKTCFFWICALQLMQLGKSVLFIQYRKNKECEVWVLENGIRRELESPVVDAENAKGVVRNLLQAQATTFDVCVCDGVISDDMFCSSLIAMLDAHVVKPGKKNRKIAKLVLVTSLQFNVSLGTEMVGDYGIVDEMSFDSWRMDDYENAVRSDLINESHTRDILLKDVDTWTMGLERDNQLDAEAQILQVVRAKYDYAGGCARYMFEMDSTELQNKFDEYCGKVKGQDWELFATTNLPGNATEAVNSLMQQFKVEEKPSICTPVSKYILLLAYDKCRAKMTSAVRIAAELTNNRSLSGWAFELEQKDEIYSALQTNRSFFRIMTAAVENGLLTFFPHAEASYDGQTVTGDVRSGSVIWCSRTNQELFDVALYFDGNLVTLQMTVSNKHSLHLDYMRPLCLALLDKGAEVNRIVHLAVVEDNEVLKGFKFEAATGRLQNTRGTDTDPSFVINVNQSGKLQKIQRFRIGPQTTSSVTEGRKQ